MEPVSKGQPEVLSLNSPLVIAVGGKSLNGGRQGSCFWVGGSLLVGTGEAEVLLMAAEVREADNPSHNLSQEAWRKAEKRFRFGGSALARREMDT